MSKDEDGVPARIGLLIPAYNAAEFLPRLLKSAADQEVPFDEIWVYDDCSTDDTAAVAEACGAKVLRGTVNKGCSAGKNALAQHVEVDWIHFHDADDELLPNFVTLSRRWISERAPDVLLFSYEYRDDQTGELILTRTFDARQLSEDPRGFAIREQINPFCGLYRRQSYLEAGGYDEDPDVLYNEDVAFHIRMAFAGLEFGAEPEVAVINYRRGGSMSAANQLACVKAHVAVMKKTLALPGAKPYETDISARLWLASGLLAAFGNWREADEATVLASRLSPEPPIVAGSVMFRGVARLFPRLAIRMREAVVKTFKRSSRNA